MGSNLLEPGAHSITVMCELVSFKRIGLLVYFIRKRLAVHDLFYANLLWWQLLKKLPPHFLENVKGPDSCSPSCPLSTSTSEGQ